MSTDTSQVDVRGPRFAAWVTTTVLVITLVVSAFNVPAAAAIVGAQAVVFAISALRGLVPWPGAVAGCRGLVDIE